MEGNFLKRKVLLDPMECLHLTVLLLKIIIQDDEN